ncbi:glycosyltransferase family 4 protein [Blastopirellula sp. JC732]|uniref:Glycosyltransferase family 4 protein n=1 Tax=Blastopirellula sediminis TaxID=2894196 RepID=A0A9X1MSH0_9BACT|nr:glycosyltransferase family 4 protein [Blastopirellula sediminis]MCC9605135.1 glycosyltransferase family 4 protein [Blastopirellula sediminis]MCC9631565.1 glycosyltransferase family 4 protein [Blastopirellula sediminis]
MRIAHVITRMIVGGAQENTLYNCQDLIRDFGDDVLLITGPSPGREGTLLDRTEHQVPVALAPHLVRNIYPWDDLRGYYEIKKILRDFRPDVVHTHSAKGGMLGRIAATSLRVPAVIHTVHGAPFHPYQSAAARNFFIACERYAAKRCHKMICVADAMTDLMVDAKVAPREKFVTIYSGMEVEPFLESGQWRDEMRQKLGYSDEHVVIGKIARLFHLKGHEYVLAAARRVIDAVPNVRFLWIGDGLLHDKYVEEINAAGLTDYFQLVGLVPPTEIPRYCGAMDILVHASLREGLARALPQALLSGKPAVSFDVDGAREVVVTDETGELIPPKDVDRLADALIRLASDAALRQRLGEEGRRRAAQVFPHRHMTAEIRKTYEQVLADKP